MKDLSNMKINYDRLKILNIEATLNHQTLPCFHIIQNGIEKLLYDETLSEIHKRLLIEVGVLIEENTQEERKKIVEPFKMDMGNDRTQSN